MNRVAGNRREDHCDTVALLNNDSVGNEANANQDLGPWLLLMN